jgi:hypothetical protein
MAVLQNWHDTGIPPLLGPQTSALPINQSAIYFYLLYPGFLLSNASPIAQNHFLTIYYLFFLISSLYIYQKYFPKISWYYVFGTILLVVIQPQLITQNRSVWNPSFVTPLVFISIFSFYFLIKKYSTKLLTVFVASISLAISFSYSVVPLLLIFFVYWLLFNRQHLLKYLLSIVLFLFLFNLPTLVFELRHHLLIPALFRPNSLLEQSHLSLPQKTDSITYCLVGNQKYYYLSILISLIVLITSTLYKKPFSFYLSFLHLAIITGIYLFPITVQCHYLFPLISLSILLLTCLPPILYFLSVLFLSLLFLSPARLSSYFQKAPRTYSEMSSCYQKYCQDFQEPTYVSVISTYHPWHFGPEHRYLLKQSGCHTLAIETENGQAQYMTIVLDNGKFTPQTKFYELDLFGPYKEMSRFKCLDNLEIVTLKKN